MKIAPKKPTVFRTELRTAEKKAQPPVKHERRRGVDSFEAHPRTPRRHEPLDFINPDVVHGHGTSHEPLDLINPDLIPHPPVHEPLDFINPDVVHGHGTSHEPLDLINPDLIPHHPEPLDFIAPLPNIGSGPHHPEPLDFIAPRVELKPLPKAEPFDFVGPRLK